MVRALVALVLMLLMNSQILTAYTAISVSVHLIVTTGRDGP
jgi:hypothetical protein